MSAPFPIVEELAHTRAWDLLTPEEQAAEAEIKFEPIWSNGHRMFRMAERPKLVYEKYSGLSFIEYQDKLAAEIVQNEPPEIFESFETDRSYCYGTGLIMVVHVEEINQATIEESIRRFRQVGESNWRSATPLPRSELPMETENAAFSRIRLQQSTPYGTAII